MKTRAFAADCYRWWAAATALALLPAFASGAGAQTLFADGFEPLPGVVLVGPEAAPALSALRKYGPFAVAESDIAEGGLILTRVDVVLEPTATIGEVNAVLAQEDAAIVTMRAGSTTLSLRVPRPADAIEADALLARLELSPAVLLATPSSVPSIEILPPAPAGDTARRNEVMSLLSGRFPAAWNAAKLATRNCANDPIPVLLIDSFHPAPDAEYTTRLEMEWPNRTIRRPIGIDYGDWDRSRTRHTHGYDVAATVAATFDDRNPTGAFPFPRCLEWHGVDISYTSLSDTITMASETIDGLDGKVLINASIGLSYRACTGTCTPADGQRLSEYTTQLARLANQWLAALRPNWDRVLVVSSGGNQRSAPLAGHYNGLANAAFGSPFNFAGAIASNPPAYAQTFAALADPARWTSSRTDFPTAAIPASHLAIEVEIARAGGVEEITSWPMINVGAATGGDGRPGWLRETTYSNFFPDVHAPVDFMTSLDGAVRLSGTSFAAPQVSGLAAYLWLLSPELRALPTDHTRRAIATNLANSEVDGPRSIDAYATVLSLDDVGAPSREAWPVRHAILDANDDQRFDEADLAAFAARVVDAPDSRTAPSYGRHDLNGDGFVGGSSRAEFDLDRTGSTRFSRAALSSVPQSVEGQTMEFDETRVSDVEILCYYAYSALYAGDTARRRELIGEACALIVQDEIAMKIDRMFGFVGENPFVRDREIQLRELSVEPLGLSGQLDFTELGLSEDGYVASISDEPPRDPNARASHLAVWQQRAAGSDPGARVLRYDAGTRSWSVEDVGRDGRVQQVAMDATGYGVATWIVGTFGAADARAYFATYDPALQAWSDAQPIDTDVGGDTFAYAALSNGRASVATFKHRTGSIVVRRQHADRRWDAPIVALSGAFPPTLGMDDAGNLHMTYIDRNEAGEFRCRYAHADSTHTWDEVQDCGVTTLDAQYDSIPMRVHPNGRVYVLRDFVYGRAEGFDEGGRPWSTILRRIWLRSFEPVTGRWNEVATSQPVPWTTTSAAFGSMDAQGRVGLAITTLLYGTTGLSATVASSVALDPSLDLAPMRVKTTTGRYYAAYVTAASLSPRGRLYSVLSVTGPLPNGFMGLLEASFDVD